MSTPTTSAAIPVVYRRRRRRAPAPVPPVPSPVPCPAPLTNSSSTPTRAPTTSPRPDPPAPATCHRVAPRSSMDLSSGVGPSKEITPYGSPSVSCSILATELHVAAKESLFGHFKEVIVEEITKLLCSRYDGSITQESADVPESIDARGSPDSAETMDRTPPHFSQMAPYEVPIPAAMKNNSPYLALVWQNESHITMIKLADDPSKQTEDFLSDNHASGCFAACYRAPIKSIQETSKSEILEDLNVNFDLHNQQDLERYSLGDVPKGSLKKRRRGDKSNKALSGSNHLKGKHLIDQAPPTDVCASPTSPLKKKGRRNVSNQNSEVAPSSITDLVKTARGPCEAANSNSQQDLKLVSSNNVLYTEKKKFPRHPRSNGSARTSINGWQWLEWYRNAAEAKKVITRELNGTKQSLLQVYDRAARLKIGDRAARLKIGDRAARLKIRDRAARLKIRNRLANVSPELANYIQMKGRVKKLRIERSNIHGLGVHAINKIKEGDVIVQYIGEVIRKPISDMRGLRYEKAGICDYFFKIDVNYVIDATFQGGMARYINHSCEPNCSTRVISVNGKKGIFIYAKRLIRAGEELTYNYYFPFDVEKIPCLCRSRRCRGSMN